jgi:4-hydroxy-tetrahydrodipicolinate synthase
LRRQVFGGVTGTSVGDAVEQARVVIERDCCGLLLSPPFYFKDVDDEGLYRWFSQVFETIGREARNVILYHIPSVTQIALSINLINRLKAAFPALVTGVKDSGSDWAYTRKLLLDAPGDLLVLIGNERHLADGIQRGAHGAISGLANLCPGVLLKTLETGVRDSRIDDLATEILKFPFAAAVKALLAHRQGDSTWLNVRPPLRALSPADASRLTAACGRILRDGDQQPPPTA